MSVFVGGKTKLTYEDYALLPDDGMIHEIIDGDHYVTPAPSTYHQTVSRRIQFQLYEQIEEQDKGQVFNAPTDVQFSNFDIVQPDVFVILKARVRMISEIWSIVVGEKVRAFPRAGVFGGCKDSNPLEIVDCRPATGVVFPPFHSCAESIAVVSGRNFLELTVGESSALHHQLH